MCSFVTEHRHLTYNEHSGKLSSEMEQVGCYQRFHLHKRAAVASHVNFACGLSSRGSEAQDEEFHGNRHQVASSSLLGSGISFCEIWGMRVEHASTPRKVERLHGTILHRTCAHRGSISRCRSCVLVRECSSSRRIGKARDRPH